MNHSSRLNVWGPVSLVVVPDVPVLVPLKVLALSLLPVSAPVAPAVTPESSFRAEVPAESAAAVAPLAWSRRQ